MAIAMPALVVLAGCGGTPATTNEASGALVSIAHARRGSLPATVLGYGSVAPALDGTQTLSVAQPGQVSVLHATPGMAVHAGQMLATFTVAPTARSSYEQAASTLIAARKQAATTAQLLSQQLATQDQMTKATKAVTDAEVALAALRAEGAGQAVSTLSAPFNGIVTTVPVAQGDRVQPGAAIMTIARRSSILVTVGIDPSERSGIAVGQAATLRRLSGGGKLAGRVVRADSALNPLTRMVDVDVSFPSGTLMPGEGMEVAIETENVSGWIVPHASIVTAGGPAHLFQIVAEKAKAVPVKILLASEAGDVVEGAVDPASPLIVDGAYQVHDGDVVRKGR